MIVSALLVLLTSGYLTLGMVARDLAERWEVAAPVAATVIALGLVDIALRRRHERPPGR